MANEGWVHTGIRKYSQLLYPAHPTRDANILQVVRIQVLLTRNLQISTVMNWVFNLSRLCFMFINSQELIVLPKFCLLYSDVKLGMNTIIQKKMRLELTFLHLQICPKGMRNLFVSQPVFGQKLTWMSSSKLKKNELLSI